jgi:hypoxanthine phosphoribosyltransferase
MRGGIVLRMLPQRIAYLLRWLEVAVRERLLRPKAEPIPPEETLPDPTSRELVARAERVLVVDDTVDSGRTLVNATAAARHFNPTCVIQTVALASTWRRPPVEPDYLVHPRTLIRFHCSMDTRS